MLRTIKPNVHGLRRNWQSNLITIFVKDKSANCVIHEFDNDHEKKQNGPVDVESIARFSNVGAIRTRIQEQKPIAGIYLTHTKVFAVRIRNNKYFVITLDSMNMVVSDHGMLFFDLSLSEQEHEFGDINDDLISYVLLLPLRTEMHNDNGNYYTAIDNEYKEITEDQTFDLPSVCSLIK